MRKLCCCPKVSKVHFIAAHKKALSLEKMKKTPAYRIGLLAGLSRAHRILTVAIEEAENGSIV